MTKAEEITLISQFAESLPVDSYLSPWLHEILPFVCRDITSDFVPTCYSMSHYQREANRITKEAQERASEIVSIAQQQAEKIKEECRVWSLGVKDAARAYLRRLEDSI